MNDSHILRILVLSDDKETADMWAHGLRQRGLQVDLHMLNSATINGLNSAVQGYSLIIVDVNEPGTGEVSFCRMIRTQFSNPLLVFTYEKDERLHLRIYEAGADECVAKPIGIALLLSKIQAWLRRTVAAGSPTPGPLAHNFKVDFAQRRVTTPDGKTVRLSRLEFRLFHLLITNHDQILETDLIIDRVWDIDGGDASQLKNLIYRLRQKIERDPADPLYIHTEPNFGYVLQFMPAKDCLKGLVGA